MIATILLAGSASLHISGFAMYTHHNIYSIGNSTVFVAKVVSAITGFNTDVTSRFLTEQRRFTSPAFDVTMNSTISTQEFNTPINMDTFNDTIEANNTQEGSADINFFENADIYDTWFPYESPHDVIAVLPFPISVNPSSGSRRKRGIRKVLKLLLLPMLNMRDSVPTFGYSFYLCWFGCASHVVALVCGIVYWRNNGSKCKLQRSVV
uniref:Uncharacterized protein n=1 Tax=Ciona savignyi TaxID=51511 RepID=H2ZB33_CIOSA